MQRRPPACLHPSERNNPLHNTRTSPCAARGTRPSVDTHPPIGHEAPAATALQDESYRLPAGPGCVQAPVYSIRLHLLVISITLRPLVAVDSGLPLAAVSSTIPLLSSRRARVAELADARDSKSRVPQGTCGFDPLLWYQTTRALQGPCCLVSEVAAHPCHGARSV